MSINTTNDIVASKFDGYSYVDLPEDLNTQTGVTDNDYTLNDLMIFHTDSSKTS